MPVLKGARLLVIGPGAPVPYLPVGIIAWDEQGAFYEDWAPDEERAAFWQGVVQRVREAGLLAPDILGVWAEELVNGITTDLQPVEAEIPEGRTAEEVFGELAGQVETEWAMLLTEVQDHLDGRPSLLNLFAEKTGDSA